MLWRVFGLAVIAIGGLCATLGAVSAPLFDLDRFGIPKELALHLTAAAALGLVVVGRRRLEVGIVELGLGALAAWSMLSAAFATNHWLALRSVAVTTSGVLLFGFARVLTAEWPAARRGFVTVLVVSATVAAGSGLAEAFGWSSPLFATTRSPGGLLGNRNFLAHLAVLTLPLAGWLVLTAKRPLGRLAPALAVAALAGSIVISRSRAAWLGAIAVSVVVLGIALVTRRHRSAAAMRGAMALVVAIAVGAVTALLLPNQLDWRSDTPYRDSLREVVNYDSGSGRGRMIQYRNSLRLIAGDPVFGTGPGNWAVKYPLVTTPGDPSFAGADPMPTNPWPSSDWVALLAERGPVGFAIGLGLLAAMALVAIRRAADPDPDLRHRALAALGLLTGFATVGLFDAVLLLAPPTLVAMVGLGALLPTTRALRLLDPAVGRARVAAAVLGFLTLAAAARAGAQLASMVTAGSGSPRSRLEEAVRYDPASYRIRVLLALRSPCPAARVHAEWAARLMPNHAAPRELSRRCRN
jgi:hypothetical protein